MDEGSLQTEDPISHDMATMPGPIAAGERIPTARRGSNSAPALSPFNAAKRPQKDHSMSERRRRSAPLTRADRQLKNWPPFGEMVEPVRKPASSEARNTTQRPISSGSPKRPTGICGMIFSFSTFSGTARTISVPI